jgi:DNA-binding GntR family transcriptional regulator
MSNKALSAVLQRVPSEPLSRPSAAERVGTALREQIIDGHLRPGTKLTEEIISAGLGFSRNTIREAYVLLASERLVVRVANRGVFVATPSVDDVRDIYATLRLIEPAALQHGTALTAKRLGRLREIVSSGVAARSEGDRGAVARGNQLFHREVAAASGSHRAAALMEDVLAEMRLVFHAMEADRTFHDGFVDGNDDILSLLEAGDRVGAAARMRDYLDSAEAQLLRMAAER